MGVLRQNRVKSGNTSRAPGTEAVAFWSGRFALDSFIARIAPAEGMEQLERSAKPE
jgi:hypothetical protein